MGCGCNKKKEEVKVDAEKGFILEESKTVKVEKKEEPSILTKALSLGEALTSHIADGMSKCTDKELSIRLDICHKCPERDGGTCTKCGCILSVKSGWRTSDCPMEKWPKLDK
tara:strand:- start:223 stop:558 length:336 start_codon:yes stop_codon:yes gene_type:complete